MLYSTHHSTPVGRATLAGDGKHLTGLWLEGQKYFAASSGELTPKDDCPIFDLAKRWLDRYFAGGKPAVGELPLAPAGGEFRQTVWRLLCEIPYGELTTYGAIARQVAARLGKARMSGQAIGGAVGHNPISIIIPCHRVVGSDGSLTGYAGGISVKVSLLEQEGVNMEKLFLPKKGTAL